MKSKKKGEDKSRQYDAYLIMLGVAYIKMTEATSQAKKASYQEVIDSLMERMSNIAYGE
jgi:hypothetical protein